MLLVSYDIPAEYMNHLRRTNPIESTFAILRGRGSDRRAVYPARSRSQDFKVVKGAQKNWRRLDGHSQHRDRGHRQAGRPSAQTATA